VYRKQQHDDIPNVSDQPFGWSRERCSSPWQRVEPTLVSRELDVVASLPFSDVTARDQNVVWLEGEHDIATVSDLAATLAKASSADGGDLIVDLSEVTFISSATVDLLVTHWNSLRRQSRTLTLRSPSKFTRRVLDICGLTRLIEPQIG
jgi:anti-anti-sigma factor